MDDGTFSDRVAVASTRGSVVRIWRRGMGSLLVMSVLGEPDSSACDVGRLRGEERRHVISNCRSKPVARRSSRPAFWRRRSKERSRCLFGERVTSVEANSGVRVHVAPPWTA